GVYRAEYMIPDDGLDEGGSIELRLAMEIAGDRLRFDFAGSSPQIAGALNTPLTMTKSAVYGALKAVVGPDLPTNHGFFRPTKDGIDGVAPVYMGSYGCGSSERLEAEDPVVFEGFGFVPDSAGAGRRRGSSAIYREWRFRAPGHAMVRSVRLGPAPGLVGGS